MTETADPFTDADRASFYRVLAARRDMRHFTPSASVDPVVLQRILQAANEAPSVGLMQPWRFVRVCNAALRARIAELVDAERLATAAALGERGDKFLQLKVPWRVCCACRRVHNRWHCCASARCLRSMVRRCWRRPAGGTAGHYAMWCPSTPCVRVDSALAGSSRTAAYQPPRLTRAAGTQ